MTARSRPSDAGVSLIELLIAVFVGAIVLTLVATTLTTTLQATAATRDRDLATGRAQAISTSLTTSIRNAAAVVVESAPGGGTVLRARVAEGTSAWICRAWALVDLETTDAGGRRGGADGHFELRTRSYAPLSATAPVPQPSTAWGALVDRIRGADGAAGFAVAISDDPANDLKRVTWNLEVAASEQPQLNAESTTSVSGSAVVAARREGGARCW